MIQLHLHPKVGKVPDYNNKEYGKISISSQLLSKYIGKNLEIIILIREPNEKIDGNSKITLKFDD